ncbi:MAG: stage II sporulation protein E, partial [Alistipes sp.]|nr:stage II sporulation protein E [Alistipes sp.]
LGNVGSGLPPASKMEGVDLVTEGVLTLGRVKCLLETGEESACEGGPAAALVRTMTRSDTIEFVVGTCINPLHRDPTLPVELQLRRNLINDIANILKNTYGKEVSIKYM